MAAAARLSENRGGEGYLSLRMLFTVLACAAALPGFLLAWSCYKRRVALGAKEFGIFIAACSVYATGYAGELWAGRLEIALLWSRLEYLGIAAIPTAWIFFVSTYTGRKLPRPVAASLVALSAATFLVVLTMRFHGLYYVRPWMDLSGSFPTLAFSKGPWYWIFVAYIWLSLLTGEILLLGFFFKMRSIFRMQTGIAFFGAFLPFAANTAYFLGLVPNHIDPTPFTMPVFAIPLAVSLLKYHFLDVMPIARERVFEAISDGVVVVDARGKVLDLNRAAVELLGTGSGRIGSPIAEAGRAGAAMAGLVSTEGSVEFSLEPLSGEAAPRRLRARACPVAQGGEDIGTVILVSDITETTRLLERLDELASRDGLTGLWNRRVFFENAQREFNQAQRASRPVSVCLIDLDRFKEVNDGFGHAMGDAALREASARFLARLRAPALICRYGGEEFAIFSPDCGAAEAGAVAERLRLALAAEPVRGEGGEARITGSFGVYGGVAEPGQDLDYFIARADQAMYRAKRAGKDRVVAVSAGSAEGQD
jgi:diguanylate cyclase (GGDEF)-like protein